MSIPFLIGAGLTALQSAGDGLIGGANQQLDDGIQQQRWWNANKDRLRTTTCPGQQWFEEKEPEAAFYAASGYPKVQAAEGAPKGYDGPQPPLNVERLFGRIFYGKAKPLSKEGERYWGYCIPDPVAEREKDEAARAMRLNAIERDRARTDVENIDRQFSKLVASGQSPEQALTQMNAPGGFIDGLRIYLARYVTEGYPVPIDLPSLIARNSDRIAELRRQMGTAPPVTSPVPSPSFGTTAAVLSRSLSSQLLLATALTSPFWIPVLALPALRKWRKSRGRGLKKRAR